MLLRGSGLASIPNPDDEHKDLMRLARVLPTRSTPFRPVPQDQWHLFRVRPSNHPRRRIQGAALVLEGSLRIGLAGMLRNALLSGGYKGVEQAFLARPYLGVARARDVAVNAALP